MPTPVESKDNECASDWTAAPLLSPKTRAPGKRQASRRAPRRLVVELGIVGQQGHLPAGDIHAIDVVPGAVAPGFERDPLTIGRPGWVSIGSIGGQGRQAEA